MVSVLALLLLGCPKGGLFQRPPNADEDSRMPEFDLQLGYLTVETEPWAEMWVDGSYVGTTPVRDMQLAQGTHSLKLMCGECRNDVIFQSEFVIVTEQTTRIFRALPDPPPKYVAEVPPELPYDPRRPGTLNVITRPWANVFVDDQLKGTTPLVEVKLSPGKHRVRLVCGECEPAVQRTVSVTIEPGEEQLLEYVF
jgi:hypothetical protein